MKPMKYDQSSKSQRNKATSTKMKTKKCRDDSPTVTLQGTSCFCCICRLFVINSYTAPRLTYITFLCGDDKHLGGYLRPRRQAKSGANKSGPEALISEIACHEREIQDPKK